MKQVSVTYKAPPGDNKAVEMFGHTFFDGKEETIQVDDRTLAKLQHNQHFKCGEPQDAKDKQADPKAEQASAKAAEEADEAKKNAQGISPPLRGVQLNPPPAPGQEPEDGEDAAKEGRNFQGQKADEGRKEKGEKNEGHHR